MILSCYFYRVTKINHNNIYRVPKPHYKNKFFITITLKYYLLYQ